MRHLRLIENAAVGVRAERQGDLLGRVAVVFRGRVDVVDDRVMALEADVELLVEPAHVVILYKRGVEPDSRLLTRLERELKRREVDVFVEQRANARVGRRRRLLHLGRLVVRVFRVSRFFPALLRREFRSWGKLGRGLGRTQQ